MEIFLLRHAIAEERDSQIYPNDAHRPLTKKGIQKMQEAARGMKHMKLRFDRMVSSPFARAKQTAEIVAAVFRMQKKLNYSKHLACDGSSKDLVQELKSKYKRHGSLLLVGHEPYLSELISLWVSGDGGLSVTLKKGGLCKLTLSAYRHGQCGDLEWLLSPKHLRLMA